MSRQTKGWLALLAVVAVWVIVVVILFLVTPTIGGITLGVSFGLVWAIGRMRAQDANKLSKVGVKGQAGLMRRWGASVSVIATVLAITGCGSTGGANAHRSKHPASAGTTPQTARALVSFARTA